MFNVVDSLDVRVYLNVHSDHCEVSTISFKTNLSKHVIITVQLKSLYRDIICSFHLLMLKQRLAKILILLSNKKMFRKFELLTLPLPIPDWSGNLSL